MLGKMLGIYSLNPLREYVKIDINRLVKSMKQNGGLNERKIF